MDVLQQELSVQCGEIVFLVAVSFVLGVCLCGWIMAQRALVYLKESKAAWQRIADRVIGGESWKGGEDGSVH